MVEFVAGEDERKAADGGKVAAHSALVKPCIQRQAAKQADGGLPDGAEFVQQARESAAIERAGGDVVILLEARQRCLVVPRKTECAIGEDALRVAEVAHHVVDGPLAGLVAERGRHGVIDGPEQVEGLLEICRERREEIPSLNQIHIACTEAGVFTPVGPSQCPVAHQVFENSTTHVANLGKA